MTPDSLLVLVPALFAVAFLYSTVGHAGASGYIAVMALAGVSPATIKPTALILNIAVASIGSFQFWRAGHFSWPLWWPLATLAVPCAFLGGRISLPTTAFKIFVGLVLLSSAARFLLRPREVSDVRRPGIAAALPIGGGLGFLAGLTGTGGGIFLTPLAILLRWATTKTAAAVSAVFILANSAAGLLGHLSSNPRVPELAWPLLFAAVAGGSLGSYFGSRRFSPEVVKRFLAVVLTIAGLKLILA